MKFSLCFLSLRKGENEFWLIKLQIHLNALSVSHQPYFLHSQLFVPTPDTNLLPTPVLFNVTF